MTLHAPVAGFAVNNPFGATNDQSPAGYLYTDAQGPRYISRNARSSYVAHLHCHRGEDWPTPVGSKALAVLPGKVVGQLHSDARGYYVIVATRTAYGQLVHVAQHLSRFVVGQVGKTVAVGGIIGYTGATGIGITGPHLHAEDWFTADRTLDPRNFLAPGWRALNPRRYRAGGDQANSPLVTPA